MRILTILLSLSVASPALAGPPDWVGTGGRSAKRPHGRFLTGFAMSTRADSAKNQAAADLAKKITVRIEQSTTDASTESSGGSKYEIAMVTRASTDVRLSELDYETYEAGSDVYAFAYVERAKAAGQFAARRDRALAEARACVDSAKALAEKKAAGPALNAFLGCRAPLLSAIDDEAIVHAIDSARSVSPDELAKLHRAVEDGVQALLQKKVAGVADAVEVLVLQLDKLAGRFTVAPLTYGTTEFSSVFGQHLAEALSAELAKKGGATDMVVRGTYAELDDDVAVTITVRDLKSNLPVGGGRVVIPVKSVPSTMPIKPQNFEQALASTKLIAAGEAVTGDLRVEVWTNKGDRNLVFKGGEELKLFMRVNKPAYVQLFYLMANGAKLPLEQAYYIDSSKVNRAVEYPDAFEVSPPFGIEQLFVVAHSDKPAPLPTQKVVFEGEAYEIVSEQNMVRHRGVKKKSKGAETSEASFTITTTP